MNECVEQEYCLRNLLSIDSTLSVLIMLTNRYDLYRKFDEDSCSRQFQRCCSALTSGLEADSQLLTHQSVSLLPHLLIRSSSFLANHLND